MLSMSLAAQATKSRRPSHDRRDSPIPRLAPHSREGRVRESWPAILGGSASEPLCPVVQNQVPHSPPSFSI